MFGTTWVESSLTNWAHITACQISRDAERMMAVATVDSLFFKFGLRPHYGCVVGSFAVAVEAGVVLVAALEADGNDITLRVPMRTLRAGVYAGAMHPDDERFTHDSNRSTCRTPFTLLKRWMSLVK